MINNISVIGIGKLGLCFALTLEKSGYNVLGLDISSDYVESLNKKTLISSEQNVENYLKKSTNFRATTRLADVIEFSDLIFILVATPSLPDGRYDHSQIETVIQQLELLKNENKQKHLVICSTVLPGYCDSIKDRLLKIGYTLSYNPEFIAQGTILRDQSSPDMVLIGEANPEVGQMIEDVYKKHTLNNPKICRMTPLEAEITKLSLNCFLTTKIAFANMIGDIVTKSGGNPDIVLSAIGSDSRIGNKYLRYGYGYGGPCFPRDNRALAIYASDIGLPAKISKATDESNDLHLKYQVEKFKQSNDINNVVTFETVTYKPESTLLTESQQLKFVIEIIKLGYKVNILDKREEVLNQLKHIL